MIRLSIFVFSLLCADCLAQREPVLKQIDLPHPYYYREMYLPQLTTGPSGAAWSPDLIGPFLHPRIRLQYLPSAFSRVFGDHASGVATDQPCPRKFKII